LDEAIALPYIQKTFSVGFGASGDASTWLTVDARTSNTSRLRGRTAKRSAPLCDSSTENEFDHSAGTERRCNGSKTSTTRHEMKNHRGTSWRRSVATTTLAGLVALGLAACGGSGSGGDDAATGGTGSGGVEGVDDGSTLTLWTRAPLEKQAKLLVDAYNASHENQVELTIVPNDDYVAKVGAAAGSGGLPDLFAADIVYVPNWVEQGLFQDVTDRIDQLDFADEINQGHLEAGTYEDAEYVLPFVLDVSVLFYNKELYEQAGLDPEAPPTSLEEFAEQAKA